jgi:hypothetical protein
MITCSALDFFIFAGNYSSSSEGQDVQRFMRMLRRHFDHFFQRCNLWVLGIW